MKTIIIAEAGINHNGSLKKAIKMIDIAAQSGADYIKFQHTNPDLISSYAKKSDYQKKNTSAFETQKDMIKKIHFNWEKIYPLLLKRCKKKKINFLTSIFAVKDLKKINKYKLDFIKIPSGEITNYPLLRAVAKLKKKIILSTGMANTKEITEALNIFYKNKLSKKKITLLHCVSAYPTPYKILNLNSILYLKNKYKINVGFSDHSIGIEAPIAAVALGSTVIEKHFTLDQSLNGPDHSSSLAPKELKYMINCIRNIEISLGKKNKKPSKLELKNLPLVRQSIHATNDILRGERFTKNNIALMRPYYGMHPKFFNKMFNKKSNKSYKKFYPINI